MPSKSSSLKLLKALLLTLVISCGAGGLIITPASALAEPGEASLTSLSIEELMQLEVTTAAKMPQKLEDTAAAVFVITAEDIRRSGATSIPELLRMVPGLQVARIDANKWAITARGFNGRFANKLLVLQDGRTLYNPLFSGVFWEAQGTLLEDIERIEVIRGPGASLWGANAVNGVINIITLPADETQGSLVVAGAGTEKAFGAVRQGLSLGPDTYLRAFAQFDKRDETEGIDFDANDEHRDMRAGFRIDGHAGLKNTWSAQTGFYRGRAEQTVIEPVPPPAYEARIRDEGDYEGGYLLARWEHDSRALGDFSLQGYIDFFDYSDIVFDQRLVTYDIEFQHRFRTVRQGISWGMGYRILDDSLGQTRLTSFDPDERTDHIFNAFIQDRVELIPERLALVVGSKFENNDYTGWEIQPTARLLFTPKPAQTFWASVSRAVRTPSRGENHIHLKMGFFPPGSDRNPSPFPLHVQVSGDSDVEAEELIAYEAGYRASPYNNLLIDVAFFYNDYDNLIGGQVGQPFFDPSLEAIILPATSENVAEGKTWGVELALDWRLLPWWQLQPAYTYINMDVDLNHGPDQEVLQFADSEAPHHQVSLRSGFTLSPNLRLDLWGRYVDHLENVAVDTSRDRVPVSSYLTLDARLGWKPCNGLELALVGKNLLEDSHQEFGGFDFFEVRPTEIERSVYGKITWQF